MLLGTLRPTAVIGAEVHPTNPHLELSPQEERPRGTSESCSLGGGVEKWVFTVQGVDCGSPGGARSAPPSGTSLLLRCTRRQ